MASDKPSKPWPLLKLDFLDHFTASLVPFRAFSTGLLLLSVWTHIYRIQSQMLEFPSTNQLQGHDQGFDQTAAPNFVPFTSRARRLKSLSLADLTLHHKQAHITLLVWGKRCPLHPCQSLKNRTGRRCPLGHKEDTTSACSEITDATNHVNFQGGGA